MKLYITANDCNSRELLHLLATFAETARPGLMKDRETDEAVRAAVDKLGFGRTPAEVREILDNYKKRSGKA